MGNRNETDWSQLFLPNLPSRCAICLKRCTIECRSKCCSMAFCLRCLIEKAKMESECPECKKDLDGACHNVKVQFDRYLRLLRNGLRFRNYQYRTTLTPELLNMDIHLLLEKYIYQRIGEEPNSEHTFQIIFAPTVPDLYSEETEDTIIIFENNSHSVLGNNSNEPSRRRKQSNPRKRLRNPFQNRNIEDFTRSFEFDMQSPFREIPFRNSPKVPNPRKSKSCWNPDADDEDCRIVGVSVRERPSTSCGKTNPCNRKDYWKPDFDNECRVVGSAAGVFKPISERPSTSWGKPNPCNRKNYWKPDFNKECRLVGVARVFKPISERPSTSQGKPNPCNSKCCLEPNDDRCKVVHVVVGVLKPISERPSTSRGIPLHNSSQIPNPCNYQRCLQPDAAADAAVDADECEVVDVLKPISEREHEVFELDSDDDEPFDIEVDHCYFKQNGK